MQYDSTMRLAPALFFACLFVFPGCGGPPDEPLDLAAPSDLAALDLSVVRVPGGAPPLPPMLNFGGPVKAHPAFWTVVWQGDEALGDEMNRFHDWMLKSDYWTSALGQYGVGAGRGLGVIVLPMAAPLALNATEINSLLAGIAAQPRYAPDADTAYAFMVPSTTMFYDGTTPVCDFALGYHDSTPSGLSYAIDLQCFSFGGFDLLTEVASHEAAELSTDPLPLTMPTWRLGSSAQTEVGDLCVGLTTRFDASGGEDGGGSDGGAGYVVQRLWSASDAASELRDPCVPASNPWFGVAVDPWSVPIHLVAGAGSATVNLEAFAFGSVGAIKWSAQGATPGVVNFSPARGTLNAGDVTSFKVSASNAPLPLWFTLEADSPDGRTTLWPFEVVAQ